MFRRPPRTQEKAVASARPAQPAPAPMMPHQASASSAQDRDSSGPSQGGFPVNCLQKAGVFVQKIVTTTGMQILHMFYFFLIWFPFFFLYFLFFVQIVHVCLWKHLNLNISVLDLFQTSWFQAQTAHQMCRPGSPLERAFMLSGAQKVHYPDTANMLFHFCHDSK